VSPLALALALVAAASAGDVPPLDRPGDGRASDPVAAPSAPNAPSPSPEPAAPTPTAPASPPPALTVRLLGPDGAETARARLAEPLTLELTLTSAAGATFYPPFRPALGSFELLPSPSPVQQVAGGQLTETWRFALLPVRLGVERIPAIEIPYRLADGTEGAVKTPVTRVDVEGHLANAQNPEPAPPPAPVPVITTDWLLVWLLAGLGALGVATLLALFLVAALGARFRSLIPPPPPPPANEEAFARLSALDADATLDGASRHAALVDVLRAYLGRRYAIDALEMTTRETLGALAEVDLKGVAQAEIAALLDEGDYVKFAGFTYSDADSRARLPRVRDLVERTWEPPAAAETDDRPRLEAASWRQRLLASGVDALVAGALGAGVFVALWLTGLLAWGWLAFLTCGVVLALRDAFGPSLGKRLLGLDLATRGEAQRLAPARARLVRNALLLLWPIVGPLEVFILRSHPLGARLGDLVADTAVVQGRLDRRAP
jgi:uncharacterized RDD family membrane protein YckC